MVQARLLMVVLGLAPMFSQKNQGKPPSPVYPTLFHQRVGTAKSSVTVTPLSLGPV